MLLARMMLSDGYRLHHLILTTAPHDRYHSHPHLNTGKLKEFREPVQGHTAS